MLLKPIMVLHLKAPPKIQAPGFVFNVTLPTVTSSGAILVLPGHVEQLFLSFCFLEIHSK